MSSSVDQTVHNTVGALLLGLVVAAVFYGITSLQAYWYFHRFDRDTTLHRTSVVVLWLLDTFHLALTGHAVYMYIVPQFGNIEVLHHIIWSIKVQVSINVAVIFIVQALYSYRVWKLTGYHRGILGYIVVAVVVGASAAGIILAYKLFIANTFAELDDLGSAAISASLATSTGVDFLIAGAMCFYLRKSKGLQNGLNSRISRMIQYTLSSGLLTSAFSLAAMFTYIFLPGNFVYLGIQFILTKLYVGSFFAMLNARESTREKGDTENSARGLHSQTPLQVHLHTTSFQAISTNGPPQGADTGAVKTYPW